MILAVILLMALTATTFGRPQDDIIRFDSSLPGDGTYSFSYETKDGIVAEEQGEQRPVPDEDGNVEPGTVAQGSYSYTSPEGQLIKVTYIADENGFQPVGDHIPSK